jgi:hypothetical protein
MEKLYHHDLFISENAIEHKYCEFDYDLWKGLSLTLDDILCKLNTWYEYCKNIHGLKLDLHDTNVMQRKDGTLVITGTFSEEYYS